MLQLAALIAEFGWQSAVRMAEVLQSREIDLNMLEYMRSVLTSAFVLDKEAA